MFVVVFFKPLPFSSFLRSTLHYSLSLSLSRCVYACICVLVFVYVCVYKCVQRWWCLSHEFVDGPVLIPATGMGIQRGMATRDLGTSGSGCRMCTKPVRDSKEREFSSARSPMKVIVVAPSPGCISSIDLDACCFTHRPHEGVGFHSGSRFFCVFQLLLCPVVPSDPSSPFPPEKSTLGSKLRLLWVGPVVDACCVVYFFFADGYSIEILTAH